MVFEARSPGRKARALRNPPRAVVCMHALHLHCYLSYYYGPIFDLVGASDTLATIAGGARQACTHGYSGVDFLVSVT